MGDGFTMQVDVSYLQEWIVDPDVISSENGPLRVRPVR